MQVVTLTILLDNHCINHVLHLFKRIVIDFFVLPAKKSIMNFLKVDYTFFLLVTKLNEIYYELFDWTEKAFTLVCV